MKKFSNINESYENDTFYHVGRKVANGWRIYYSSEYEHTANDWLKDNDADNSKGLEIIQVRADSTIESSDNFVIDMIEKDRRSSTIYNSNQVWFRLNVGRHSFHQESETVYVGDYDSFVEADKAANMWARNGVLSTSQGNITHELSEGIRFANDYLNDEDDVNDHRKWDDWGGELDDVEKESEVVKSNRREELSKFANDPNSTLELYQKDEDDASIKQYVRYIKKDIIRIGKGGINADETIVRRVLASISDRFHDDNFANATADLNFNLKSDKNIAYLLVGKYLEGKVKIIETPPWKRMGESEEVQLQKWAQHISEGVWNLPDTPKKINQLEEIMAEPFVFGTEGDNAKSALDDIIGDDRLSDELTQKGTFSPEADARKCIADWFDRELASYDIPMEMSSKIKHIVSEYRTSNKKKINEWTGVKGEPFKTNNGKFITDFTNFKRGRVTRIYKSGNIYKVEFYVEAGLSEGIYKGHFEYNNLDDAKHEASQWVDEIGFQNIGLIKSSAAIAKYPDNEWQPQMKEYEFVTQINNNATEKSAKIYKDPYTEAGQKQFNVIFFFNKKLNMRVGDVNYSTQDAAQNAAKMWTDSEAGISFAEWIESSQSGLQESRGHANIADMDDKEFIQEFENKSKDKHAEIFKDHSDLDLSNGQDYVVEFFLEENIQGHTYCDDLEEAKEEANNWINSDKRKFNESIQEAFGKAPDLKKKVRKQNISV